MRSRAPVIRRLSRPLVWVAALALFLFTLRSVSLEQTWVAVRELEASSVLVLVLLNAAALVLFATRWWVLLRGLGVRIGILRASLYRLGSFGVAYFTPGPQVGGEPVQVLALEKRHGVPRRVAIASVALDRVLEGIVNFGYLAAASVVLLRRAEVFDLVGTAGSLGMLFTLPVVYLVGISCGYLPVTAVVGSLFRVPRFIDGTREAESTAGRFCREHPGHLVLGLVASVGSFGLVLFEYGLMAAYLGLPLGPGEVVLGLTAARISYLLFLPAGLGVFEAGQVLAVTAMSLPPALGLSMSFVIRARDTLLGGAGLLWTLRSLVGWRLPTLGVRARARARQGEVPLDASSPPGS
jgi:uncharacterized protein (TIRG00374 family)